MALVTFLVEDNSTIRDNLIPALEDLADATVIGFAETEAKATQWLADNGANWHLAVVDMFLKEGSGLGVLRDCMNRQRHQRVVVLTNYATADMRERCMTLGADAVFDKSNEIDAFLEYCNERWPSQFASL
ncbi:response regulator [Variovorax sp. J22R133]|uniref:response regulator n=1 Tax=Variovorax brevis TaxID=3053503 RepID=UPI00257633D2|nr:response regulator [Variovorax sp. J22R133]MDM0112793.1 response regulator [Variovorax sp. J22R133]